MWPPFVAYNVLIDYISKQVSKRYSEEPSRITS